MSSGKIEAAVPGSLPEERVARDHQAISRLADDLLPALIAKLGASGLGEIEVREGQWKARLRKPAGSGQPASVGLGHSTRTSHVASHPHSPAEDQERHAREAEAAEDGASLPIVAVSPAVGVFQPRKDLEIGMRVRAGDRIGAVDVLGVREDVVAPIDGVIGASLVEAGEAVEYGQELIRIELPENVRALDISGVDREAAAVLGEA
jgi:biotin carboxyl carrier protein